MNKITIGFYNYALEDEYTPYTHCYTHIAAVIENEEDPETPPLIINFAAQGSDLPQLDDEESIEESAHDTIDLYSDKDISTFRKMYEKRYKIESYGTYHNCADAVNEALDYFFPEARQSQYCYYFIKALACIPSMLCCGYLCAPAPLLISTPDGVFSKAKSIAKENKKNALLTQNQFFQTSFDSEEEISDATIDYKTFSSN